MMSSDWQLEQTGVDRAAGRLTIVDGWDDSWFRLNGLRSKACCMTQPIGNSDFLPKPKDSSLKIGTSSPESLIPVDCGDATGQLGHSLRQTLSIRWHRNGPWV